MNSAGKKELHYTQWYSETAINNKNIDSDTRKMSI